MTARGLWHKGVEISHKTFGPITPGLLQLYAEAACDFHPLHTDQLAARQSGYPDVIAPGMLIMGWLGRCLTEHIELTSILEWRIRFVAITFLHDVVDCKVLVDELLGVDGDMAKLHVLAEVGGQRKLEGTALVKTPSWARRIR